MDRREYIVAAGTALGGTLAGCLSAPDRSEPRSFGEKQHRNNIAMAATAVETTETIATDAGTIQPERYERFALVDFWAENLVDSQRVLPVVEATTLTVDGTTYEFENRAAFDNWQARYEGGTVEPGVIHHGYIPFEIAGTAVESVLFTVPATAGDFDDALGWETA